MLNILIEIETKLFNKADTILNKRLKDIRKTKDNIISMLYNNNNIWSKLKDDKYISILKKEIGPINRNTIEVYYNLISSRTGINEIGDIMEYVQENDKLVDYANRE